MDGHTELAIKKYFDHNILMECDKVFEDGTHDIVIFRDAESVIQEVNNAVDYELYMPI